MRRSEQTQRIRPIGGERRGANAEQDASVTRALAALASAGVNPARCDQVAARLRQHEADPVAWMIAGLELGRLESLARDRDREAEAPPARELERLVDGFAGEISKLDEVLGVLSAYVRRMRGSATPAGPGPEDPLH